MTMNLFQKKYIIGVTDVEPLEYGYTSLSPDPNFIIKPDKIFSDGWHRITLWLETGSIALPMVYFDFGSGFGEHTSVLLRQVAQSKYVAVVKLDVSPIHLRLDPLDCVGEFKINSFKVERLSNFKFAQFATSKALGLLMTNPVRNFSRIRRAGLSLLNDQKFRAINPLNIDGASEGAYQHWIRNYDFSHSLHGHARAAEIDNLIKQPKISVLMPVYNVPAKFLNAAIKSVENQIYTNWELCICNDASSAPHIRPLLDEWTKKDSRIKVIHRKKNGHISNASNSALTLVTSDWVAMLDHDDELRAHALLEVVTAINENPNCQIIYSDEDKIDESGLRSDPHFKCDFSPELFRSLNYLNHITVHKTENIVKVGAWRPAYVGSQDYDLTLRIWERIRDDQIVHIPKVLYHWRAIEGSTALNEGEKDYTVDAGLRALEDHLSRMSLGASAEIIPDVNHFRVKFDVPEPQPLVSIVIPTKDHVNLLKDCIDSIYMKTKYSNFEVIVLNNNSKEDESFEYFKILEQEGLAEVITYNVPFNYSLINNYAVSKSKGSIIALVNNDIEIISEGWLTEMVSWCQQDDIGCVGAKLYFENGQIQHAGVIVGLGGAAGHAHKYFPRDAPGYYYRAQVAQNLSAVTAACLLVRREVYDEVNGLNDKDLIVAFNDVDFCLKVQEAGYRNVWTPFAEMYHYESISRGAEDNPEKIARFNREIDYMQTRWAHILSNDPYYSPNLTKDHEDFSIRR